MNIDDLTLGQAKELAKLLSPRTTSHSLSIGQNYLIRTVTMTYTGRLTAITDSDLVLDDAAWIADTGRFADALGDGTLDEVEPYPDSVIVSRASIVDAARWLHPLPREQK